MLVSVLYLRLVISITVIVIIIFLRLCDLISVDCLSRIKNGLAGLMINLKCKLWQNLWLPSYGLYKAPICNVQI